MKIPEHAKKVVSGILYDVYQWPQELFDGSVTTFEGLKRRPGVQIIAIKDNKLVLLRETQPGTQEYLSIPGGNCDSEDIFAEAKRELEEETGLVSDEWILWRTTKPGLQIDCETHYYIAKNCKLVSEQNLDPGGEKIIIEYVTFEEFLNRMEQGHVGNTDLKHMFLLMKYNTKLREEFEKEFLH